jgi:NADPH:quinone reductase-like Zn-dependent oxidoreductase
MLAGVHGTPGLVKPLICLGQSGPVGDERSTVDKTIAFIQSRLLVREYVYECLNEWGKAIELEELPQPEPNENEVLVRVHAASVNPFDSAVQLGYLQSYAKVPMTMGTDFAGEVVSVGSNITHVKPGDAVYGLCPLGAGAFAEYTLAKAHEVVLKPRSLDYIHASTVPLPTMAAWKSLFELLQVKSGERLLILGAAGNVGSLAVQLAKAEGLYIYGVDVPEKAEHILKLGLDQFIPGTDHFEEVAGDVDAVLDLLGGEYMDRSYNMLKPGGRYVNSLMAETPQEEPQRRGIRSMGLAAWPDAGILAKMTERIDAGEIKVHVDRTYPLEGVNEAMAYRHENKIIGKVVLTLM